ncbi:MAG: hypothetical protein RIE73_35845 [Coleofasciculus sp. C1-SOL-03]|uniref:hypothetical protein n=1 Tax=Coleofasciculus sp. C1-SOL-03 TaxID=3069522 RepID=UPI0032F549CF
MELLQQVRPTDSPQTNLSHLKYGFTYKISQELEEQMLLIKIFLKLLEDSQGHLSDDQQLEYLQMIQDSVHQMTQALHEAIEDFVAETG